MFTRRVIMSIKPGSAAEVARIFRDAVIPTLRGQRGMRHDDAFISPELSEAVVNSYWDTQEYAESYDRAAYPASLESLSKVLEGTPQVETFVISSATFRQITARRRQNHRAYTLGRGDLAFGVIALDDLNVRAPRAARLGNE
jgi:hypothetical protein